MDTPLEATRNDAALTQHWREKLRDGASVEELVDYLYDHGYGEIRINALKVIRDASGLSLIEAVHVRDTVWSRRKVVQICRDMLAEGANEEAILSKLGGFGFSQDELRDIIRMDVRGQDIKTLPSG